MDSLAPFERYQPLINNWTDFKASLSRPLPTCIWTNTLRTSPEHLAHLLAEDGLPVEPLAWYPGGFKLPPAFKPGHHWAYLAGLYHVQEEVAMLPVIFLDLQPGERVLDLCAAPGNKTAQIALQLNNNGTVVANDINYGRMRAVRQALERLGLVNVTTTTCDGANFPKLAGQFDKVLVDVPCSCEGTSRKDPGVVQRAGPEIAHKKNGLQKALLRKAVQRCKAGGRIVYATCTYAPEENEMVVDTILREYGADTLQIVPARLKGFTANSGLTAWQGHRFHPLLRNTMRVWPHQNDTGGFYIAVLKKLGRSGPPGRANGVDNHPPKIPLGDPSISMEPVEIFAERFGISPASLGGLALFEQKEKRVFMVSRDHQPPRQPQPDAVGTAFMSTRLKYPKLSTAAAMLLGRAATKNYINLTPQQVQAYVNRQDFSVSTRQSTYCTGIGYVLVRYRGFVLGVALYRPANSGGGVVQSMFPKGWSPNKGNGPVEIL